MTSTFGEIDTARDIAAYGDVAERIAVEVSTCPGVAHLSSGPAATYLPYRTVPGVVVNPDAVSVSIAARPGRALPEVADEVRVAARRAVPDRRIDVIIDDIAEDAGNTGDSGTGDRPAGGSTAAGGRATEGADSHG